MDRFEAMRTFVAVVDANGFAPAAPPYRSLASAATRLVAPSKRISASVCSTAPRAPSASPMRGNGSSNVRGAS